MESSVGERHTDAHENKMLFGTKSRYINTSTNFVLGLLAAELWSSGQVHLSNGRVGAISTIESTNSLISNYFNLGKFNVLQYYVNLPFLPKHFVR